MHPLAHLNISSFETLSIVVQISKLTLQKHIKEILEEIENYNKTVSFTYQIKKIFFTYDEIKPKNAIKVSRKYLRKLWWNLFEIVKSIWQY